MTNPTPIAHSQSTVSEVDFLARVAAFERNEEAEARRAKDAMRRMVSDQTRPPRHDNRGSGGPRSRRDRSPSTGPTCGIFRDFPYHFTGSIPTSSQPPPHPVAGFHIYGHHTTSVYPFYDIQQGGPPPLQDPYHDALVLVSAPYLATPFASHTARLSDPAPFPGGPNAPATTPPFMIVPHPSAYYPHPDLTRDTHDPRGRERASRRSCSPDRDHSSSRANATWQYTSSPFNPHGHRTHTPPAPPPRLSSTLAPPTSPTTSAFRRAVSSSSKHVNNVDAAVAHAEPNQHQKRATSFRIDYDLRTHPASLRLSPASSAVLSKPASIPKEQVNIRLNPARA